ncbi:MAG: Ycf66 family protein [Snowella sp.]|nr:Ycf66 family protein [Snowella sp.]
MVNFGLNSASILGIFLAVAGAGLYFLRSIRPEVSRDYDIFFSAVGLLCGLILLFQGWRLDPILQFGQLLLTGSTVFFAFETIRLRGITTEQARRNSPIADDRRVSKTRVYTEAELDQIEPYEEEDNYSNKRRLRGYAEPRPSRSMSNEVEPPRPSSRNRRPAPPATESKPPRRSRPSRRPEEENYESWNETDMWDENPAPRRPRRPRPESDQPESPRAARPSRPRPESPTPSPRQYEDEPPAAYVDYLPIEESEMEQDSWESPSSESEQPNRDRPSEPEDNPSRFDY